MVLPNFLFHSIIQVFLGPRKPLASPIILWPGPPSLLKSPSLLWADIKDHNSCGETIYPMYYYLTSLQPSPWASLDLSSSNFAALSKILLLPNPSTMCFGVL